MTEVDIKHLHEDILKLKKDMSVIKHILSEEGKLTEWAEKELAEARAMPDSEYIPHEELKKRILK
jgi:hypothetical protein